MYYYKSFDENGTFMGVLTCDSYLEESETQVAITEEEYNILLAEIEASWPEPEENNEATEADYIQSLEELGVTFNE